jgi:hypothetical protein
MTHLEFERLTAVEPVMQPSPGVAPDGDCFACATVAMVKHFWPSEAASVTVADAVEWWRHENGAIQNAMHIADRILANLPQPFRLEVHTDPFIPNVRGNYQQDIPYWYPSCYEQRIEAYLAAGYIGFTSINLHGAQRMLSDQIIPEGNRGAGKHYKASTDHNVLVDGRRDFWGPRNDSGCSALERQMHIACSVKGGYWIATDELLEMHGGMFIWWCRP